MDLRETYNRIAEDWHKDHLHDDWWIQDIDTFVKKLPPGAHVLDVGCGSGVKSKYLIEHGLRVTGIDISEKLLDIARREAPQGDYRVFSMTDLDVMSEMFDGVFAQASLLHIPRIDAGEVVRKMSRRLRPGGLLHIAVKETRDGKPEEGVQKESDYGYEFERFFSYFTMDELEKYLTDARLSIVSKFRSPAKSGKTVWLQIIGKK
jgi:2-polyprenyl-3-methyl-5-hydroxy-6-metoxy-1,4-benzoquinol methylase